MKKFILLLFPVFVILFTGFNSLSQSADDHFINAFSKYMSGDKEGAIEEYSKAIELKNDYADAFFNRAILYDNLENYKAAINDYTSVIAINPNSAEAYLNRGMDYKLINKTKKYSLNMLNYYN